MGYRGTNLAGIAAAILLAVFVASFVTTGRLKMASKLPAAALAPPVSHVVITPASALAPRQKKDQPESDPATVHDAKYSYEVRADHWTPADEQGFGEFVAALGEADCHTVDDCLHSDANPFRASDSKDIHFQSDDADLPYVLRAYYAWKKGLPFSYVSDVATLGNTQDYRYTPDGNAVAKRTDVLSGSVTGYEMLNQIRDAVSSATYRMGPDLDDPVPDLYSPAITAKSIRPGTLVYDPNGHVVTVYRVDPDGRINYVDAHPDNSMTRGFYDLRFERANPGMGAGFKNWRSATLVDATRDKNGVYQGGHVVLPRNRQIADFSDMQYFGTGSRPANDTQWAGGRFALNGKTLDYYDYVRAVMAGGKLQFDPVKEIGDLVDSNCADLYYRSESIDLAIGAGLQNEAEPKRLPANIYGAEGDWGTYSSPSRDARLKTAFKELRDQAQRFVTLYRNGDSRLAYKGSDLAGDMIAAYDRHAARCRISYIRTDGSQVSMGYDDARRRLFLMSFDPRQCIERRWGASDAAELSTCQDNANKQAWYAAEQNLRNQLDRTYDTRMNFTLDELQTPGAGKGVAKPPDIDARAYLVSVARAQMQTAAR